MTTISTTTRLFPGYLPGYAVPAPACTLFGTVWWDGQQYRQSGVPGRPDLVAHAQGMVANDGAGQAQQTVISPDGSTWILQYDGPSRSVSIYQCAPSSYAPYAYGYSYPLYGFRDGSFFFRGSSFFPGGAFRGGGRLRGVPSFLAGLFRKPIF